MSKSNCLLVLTGALNTVGGIASVNRMMISCLVEKFLVDAFVLNENIIYKYQNINGNLHLVYSCFGGNKVSFSLRLWSTLLKKNYALIICDHINLSCILAPFAKIRKDKYFVWIFGTEVFSPKPTLEGLIGIKSAARCIAISDFTYLHVNERFPDLDIRVCELAIEKNWYEDGIFQDRMKGKQPVVLSNLEGERKPVENRYILHVGRMDSNEKYKGQDLLIECFPKVLERHPRAELVLIGEGSDMPRLKKIAGSLPGDVREKIYIPGYVSQDVLALLYQKCGLFAMPSTCEGFGLVYLEAMSWGKSCVGVEAAATPYLIKDGITGLLVKNPPTAKEIAEKINFLLDHPEQAEAMGKNGYELVKSNYLFYHFKERFWQAIES